MRKSGYSSQRFSLFLSERNGLKLNCYPRGSNEKTISLFDHEYPGLADLAISGHRIQVKPRAEISLSLSRSLSQGLLQKVSKEARESTL
jgi:hypothetical protein